MPVHPSEEEAPMGLTEKVAKDPSSATETTASDHPGHANEHTPSAGGGSGGGATAKATDFMSKGPQIPKSMDDMPPKASREETEAKMRELNQ
ncbi:MAG: hypothetical protein OHK93_000473 [Ramalina farinacea]|uniref:Uncharacterized protein n=1 Tax=Ramalina farinacea TaxID=258253 RepID=A0AA43QI75_9LECA|nr:hypothetical protein [Ramalina farinacea]